MAIKKVERAPTHIPRTALDKPLSSTVHDISAMIGSFDGFCNNSKCRSESARWFHFELRTYFCRWCATKINKEAENIDFTDQERHGHNVCLYTLEDFNDPALKLAVEGWPVCCVTLTVDQVGQHVHRLETLSGKPLAVVPAIFNIAYSSTAVVPVPIHLWVVKTLLPTDVVHVQKVRKANGL